jgi:Ni/Fe-hydrogenase subunit HybB-like protein
MTATTQSTPSFRRGLSNLIKKALASINWLVVVLGMLTLAGVVGGVWRLFTGLGASTGLNDGFAWGIWIGFDFTLIAFAGAGFTMAAVVHILGLERFKPAMRPAIMAGFLGYIGVLALLVLDLGRPDRFYGFMINFNAHSPLFEICWCVLLYSMVLVVENTPPLLEGMGQSRWAHRVERLLAPVVIFGVTLSSLHQSTLGTLYLLMPYRLHELWYTPILPLQFFSSSVVAGLSVAIVAYKIACKVRRTPADQKVGAGLAKGAMWVALIVAALRIGEVIYAGHLPQLLTSDPMSQLWRAEVAVGVLLPLLIFAIPSLRESSAGQWIGSLLFLGGVMINRFSCTLFAQTGREGTTYLPSAVEWISTIGVLAAVALAWYIAMRILPVVPRRKVKAIKPA